ncbi:hypothetical protein RYX56_08240 [Alkalihalophilus lindianensis]|uniref:Uncharacterized protein n=1 Tax=Alkalihalophilus lindianensis TaxID=1630542 RepID=A0ABU3X900_9BACI|nr:hypothetical protein [Alkalihalophilus lindianensis]MDV2684357.1 hypothetical protein [Alkalihalophilus lindianensis]
MKKIVLVLSCFALLVGCTSGAKSAMTENLSEGAVIPEVNTNKISSMVILTSEQERKFEEAQSNLSEEVFEEIKSRPGTTPTMQAANYKAYLYTSAVLTEEQFFEVKEEYFADFVDYEVYREFADALFTPEQFYESDGEMDITQEKMEGFGYYIIGMIEVISPREK